MGVAMGPLGAARGMTAFYRTRWGIGSVRVTDGVLVEVTLPQEEAGTTATGGAVPGASADHTSRSSGGERAQGVGEVDDAAIARGWAAQLEEYFAGQRRGWSRDELRGELDGLGFSEFTRDVYEALLETGCGETVGYGELALRAGYPRAGRAVGTAMARNPLPVVIPCHRVIRADGVLGRYGTDPSWKPRLLSFERGDVG